MANVLALPCNMGRMQCNATFLAIIEQFRQSMIQAYAPLLSSPTNGGYLSACYQHCHQNIEGIWALERVQSQTTEETFFNWWMGAPNKTLRTLVVDGAWGSNSHCA